MSQFSLHGWRRQGYDPADRVFSVSPLTFASLPPELILSEGMPPLFNQDRLGACGPFTSRECIGFERKRQGSPIIDPSALFIYYASRLIMGSQYVNQDSGVDNRSMMKAMAQYGYPSESQYPYNESIYRQRPPDAIWQAASANRISGYSAVPQSIDQMKACIATANSPFVYGFTVYQSMLSDAVAKTGIVPMPTATDRVAGGHDVTIFGYSDSRKAFRFRNHWVNGDGSPWGDGGCGWMPYAYATNSQLSGDFWRIDAVPGDIPPWIPPPPPDPGPPPPPPPTGQLQIRVELGGQNVTLGKVTLETV